MWKHAAWVIVASLVAGCGADETLTPPAPPAPEQSTAPLEADAGVDFCGALWSLVETPGMPERLCALQSATPDSPDAISQCKLCAAGATFVADLLPPPMCSAAVRDCPVSTTDLTECFEVLGEIITELVPGCEPDRESAPPDPTELGLRVATSGCAPVMADCQPIQQLVVNLLGGAL